MKRTTPPDLGKSRVIKAVLASSAACLIIFVRPAIVFASRRMARSRSFYLPSLPQLAIDEISFKVCLFDAKEVSLRDEMRRGATDVELLQTIGQAVLGKQEKHVAMEDIDVVTNRPMILIGG